MDLAVVIPVYQMAPQTLHRCLESVVRQVKDSTTVDIIVIDSSSNALAEELSCFQERVQFYFTGRRMYAGEARNFGAAKTTKKYLAFLDGDCIWGEKWFDTALLQTSLKPEGLAFNGPVLFEDARNHWASALHLMEFHEFLSSRPGRQRFLHSGNLLILASFFKKVGGFRANWPACEDIGFLNSIHQSLEIRNQIYFVPGLSVCHTAHLIERDRIFKKARFMGYWRGFYDNQLPYEFRISSKRLFFIVRPLLGFAFWMIILVRCWRLKCLKLMAIFTETPRLLVLTLIWSSGFTVGFAKATTSGLGDDSQNTFKPSEPFATH